VLSPGDFVLGTLITVKTSQKTGFYGFVVLCFIFFFVYLHRVSTAAMAPDLMQAFSTTATELGILSSMYFYAYALMQIPTGILIDSVGPRKTVTVFTVLTASGALLFGLSTTLFLASVARFLIGIGVSIIFVSTIKILNTWFRPDEVSSYFGIFVLVGNLGAIGAAAPLTFVTLVIGWRLTFGIFAFIAVIQIGLAWRFIRDRPDGSPAPASSESSLQSTSRPFWVELVQIVRQIKGITRNPLIIKLAVVVFVTYGTLIAFQGLWGIPYLMQVYSFTKAEASYLLTLIAIGFSIGAPLFGILSDKVFRARKPIYCLGVVLYVLMWVPLGLRTTNLSVGLLYLICFGLGFFHGAVPVGITMIQEHVPKQNVGVAVGYMNLYPMLGIAVFQPLIGWILDHSTLSDPSSGLLPMVGYTRAFQICLLCLLSISFISLTVPETFRPTRPRS